MEHFLIWVNRTTDKNILERIVSAIVFWVVNLVTVTYSLIKWIVFNQM